MQRDLNSQTPKRTALQAVALPITLYTSGVTDGICTREIPVPQTGPLDYSGTVTVRVRRVELPSTPYQRVVLTVELHPHYLLVVINDTKKFELWQGPYMILNDLTLLKYQKSGD